MSIVSDVEFEVMNKIIDSSDPHDSIESYLQKAGYRVFLSFLSDAIETRLSEFREEIQSRA